LNKLLLIVVPIADHLAKKGVFPAGNERLTEAIKSEAYYNRELRRMVKNFYNGYLTDLDFIGVFANIIFGQTLRAYMEGLLKVGFDTNNMTGAMYAEIDEIRRNEENFVLDFIQQIKDARDAETGFEQFFPRVDVWTNRYPDIVNRGVLAGAQHTGVLLEWKLGVADHCATCVSLDGTVALAYQWSVSGFRPQSPPNDMLECGGWNCQCTLEPTDKPATIPADGILSL